MQMQIGEGARLASFQIIIGSRQQPAEATHVIAQTLRRIRQGICGMHGHEFMLHFERSRLSLRCTMCGRQTPGWVIGPKSLLNRPRSVPTQERAVAG